MLPPLTLGLPVKKIPRGSLRATGSDPLESTPGGSVRHRRVRTPSPPVSVTMAKRIEELDLTDEEIDGDDETKLDYVIRYMGQGIAPTEPVARSTAAEENLCSASENASIHSQETSIHPGSVANVSSVDADVRPSSSRLTDAPSRRVAKCDPGSDFDSDFEGDFEFVAVEMNTAVGTGREIPNDEDLDEFTRTIITSAETAMDDEVDRLVSVDNSFDWEADFETFRGVPEVFSGPAPGPLKTYDTPYDVFTDIWSRDIMERIANETNKYAKQTIDTMKATERMKPSSRLLQWTDTDADEIMLLFAVYMFMGIDQRTSQKEYWKSDFLAMPKFKELMTYSRYILLSKFLHFVDNVDVGQHCPPPAEARLSPRLAKLIPVISHLNEKFSSLYNLEKNISIDESLTLFKGRLSWVQTIRTKAARFGIKSYELCESRTGYLAKFQIYTGAGVALSVDLGGKTTKVVLKLLQGLERRGHCVTMDNFYNCPALARYLKNSLGSDCLGTLRPNRKHVPREVAKVSKNESKGTIIARHCGDVSVLAWKDANKWVNMISTYHDAETYVRQKAGERLVKPVVVNDYNKTMGGVDLKDQRLSMYLLERKRCVKWYIKMFKRLLNVSIHNAFIMYAASLKKQGKPPMTHREFRITLANSLAEQHRRRSVPTVIIKPTDQPIRLRRDVVHTPMNVRGRGNDKRCAVHQRLDSRKLVHTKCATCDVFLCFETCWDEWHSLADLKGREIRGRKRKRD